MAAQPTERANRYRRGQVNRTSRTKCFMIERRAPRDVPMSLHAESERQGALRIIESRYVYHDRGQAAIRVNHQATRALGRLENSGPRERSPTVETRCKIEKSRPCPGVIKGSWVPLQSDLVFFGLVIMMPTPRWFQSLRDLRRWPPSRHGGRDETSCSGRFARSRLLPISNPRVRTGLDASRVVADMPVDAARDLVPN